MKELLSCLGVYLSESWYLSMEQNSIPRKNATEWLSIGKYYEFEKNQIFYIREGRGSNLILLHGYPTSSWDYSKIFAGLTRFYSVSVLDFLGFGYSAKPKKYQYSIHKQTDLLEKYIDKQAFKRVKFVFHDYSVSIGQEILARFAERGTSQPYQIDGMVFLNGGLLPDLHRPTLVQRLLAMPVLGSILVRFLKEESFGKAIAKVFGPNSKPDPKDIATLWKLILYPGNARLSHILLHYIKDRKENQSRWEKALFETHIPLLFLNGLEDPVSGKHLMTALEAKSFVNARFKSYETLGHYPHWESPESVYQAIREFYPD